MVTFKIQEVSKVRSCGAWCSKCGHMINMKKDQYRIAFGTEKFHLSCFYSWLTKSLNRLNNKHAFLTQCEQELKPYMTTIIAESLIKDQKV